MFTSTIVAIISGTRKISSKIPTTLRQISTRGIYLPQETHTSAKYARGRIGFKLDVPSNNILVEFPNWIAAGFNAVPANYLERGTGGPMSLTCSVEYPPGSGNFYQGLNNGNPIHTVADLGDTQHVISLPITIPADTMANLLFYVDMSGGAGFTPYLYCPPRTGSNSGRSNLSFNDVWQFSDTVLTDNTMTGTGYTNNGGALGSGYGPTAICGLSSAPAVASIGTSIDCGEGALSDTTLGTSGEIAMSLSRDKIAYGNFGVRGDRYVTAKTSYTKRKRLIDLYYNYIVFGGDTNGINLANRTASQSWSDLQELAAMFPNHRKIACSPLPIGQSGNIPKVGIDQERRVPLKNLIRDNCAAAGFYGYFDLGVTVEETPDSGIWKSGYTADFVHPLINGYNGIKDSGAVNTNIITAF